MARIALEIADVRRSPSFPVALVPRRLAGAGAASHRGAAGVAESDPVRGDVSGRQRLHRHRLGVRQSSDHDESTAADGTPVVRERYWISAQVGEIRACDGCHGVSRRDQADHPPAQNTPQALHDLLLWWQQHGDAIFSDGFQLP